MNGSTSFIARGAGIAADKGIFVLAAAEIQGLSHGIILQHHQTMLKSSQ
jgi:hypothetical protein